MKEILHTSEVNLVSRLIYVCVCVCVCVDVCMCFVLCFKYVVIACRN